MKLFIALSLVVLAGGTAWPLLLFHKPPRSNRLAVVRPKQPTGPSVRGSALAAPRQVLRTPTGGHVWQVLVSDGQRVNRGDSLLKLLVGPDGRAQPHYLVAPTVGEVTSFRVSAGHYLAAGMAYAHLVLSTPVRVRIAAADAASLRPGDSLRVVAGPPALLGRAARIAAMQLDSTRRPATTVLVLAGLRWSLPVTVRLELVPLSPRSIARLRM